MQLSLLTVSHAHREHLKIIRALIAANVRCAILKYLSLIISGHSYVIKHCLVGSWDTVKMTIMKILIFFSTGSVNITEQPVSTALLVGETASFSCVAVSRPAPTITWFRVESGPVDVQLIDGVENISIVPVTTDNNTTSSDLSVPVRGTEDFTQYFCVAENGFDNQTSDRVELIAAGKSTI